MSWVAGTQDVPSARIAPATAVPSAAVSVTLVPAAWDAVNAISLAVDAPVDPSAGLVTVTVVPPPSTRVPGARQVEAAAVPQPVRMASPPRVAMEASARPEIPMTPWCGSGADG